MIAIQINRGGFNQAFNQKLKEAENPVAVLMAAGRELANQLRKHFRGKEQTDANRLSPRRSHFWLAVMRSVNNPEQTGYNAISVRVSDPRIALKVFGGTIVPKEAGALTIPVSEEAYDRRASTFEAETGLKLFLVRTGKGSFSSAVLATKREGGLQVEYLLVSSVTQKPDPTALPPQSDLEKAILERAQAVVDRQLSEN